MTPMLATAIRLLTQLRHDHRSLALVAVLPVVLISIAYALFDGAEPLVDRLQLDMMGVFPLILMCLLTSVAMLRERTSGTLERLMTTPITPWGLIGAYALAFGLLAAAQVAILSAWCFWALDLDIAGPVLAVLLVGVVNALMGVALGLFASAFARTEFQAIQMFPVLVIPQILLCGLFGRREDMAGWLQPVSDAMPLRYSVEALEELRDHSDLTATYWTDLGIVAAVVVGVLVLASLTLRRRSA